MYNKTSNQYDKIIEKCKHIFLTKMEDYGSAWRVLRPSSLTDQIYIKAERIKSFEEKGIQKIDEEIDGEYIGIINYSVMALIQLELGTADNDNDISKADAEELFTKHFKASKALMENKNHDYSEAWRNMRRESLTDIILMKLLRVKQIEDNAGETKISEGVDANYRDIINYAVFALIKLEENK
ncbi:MAG: DUF1599 domain-containing protein [Bacteroidales bacterium]|nr:DUF1599 domain-containing protein [Bacteroidales bacterium]